VNYPSVNHSRELLLGLPKPLSDQFPVRVCPCPLCILTVCESSLCESPCACVLVSLLYIGLYTRLPCPILYGMYCNKGWSGRNTVLRNSVGDNGGSGVAKQRGCLRITVLILVQSPRAKRISCKGQVVYKPSVNPKPFGLIRRDNLGITQPRLLA